MTKLVVVDLIGDFEQGFQICAQLHPDHGDSYTDRRWGKLPANLELQRALETWQLSYREFGSSIGSSNRIKFKKFRVQRSSQGDLKFRGQHLRLKFKQWLKTEDFRELDTWLRQKLDDSESGRIVINSDLQSVHQLPWEQWDLVKQYSLWGITFSRLDLDHTPVAPPAEKKKQVRILAIFGSSDQLNLEVDKNLLKGIKQSYVEILEQPTREALDALLWSQNWDIISFSGHSQTIADQGIIHLNQQESLSIGELEHAFRQAVTNGLKLAIFNSCDGLGLAYNLGKLGLPNAIVMREPVIDSVAQLFLKHLITEYSNGLSLPLATRRAREKLQVTEAKYPFSTWLPLLYQDQTASSLSWSELLSPKKPPSDRVLWFLAHTLGTIAACFVVWTIQNLGWFQVGELDHYDRALSLRPPEARDERITIVTVSEKDIKYQGDLNMSLRGSLADEALESLLRKVQPYQPVAIASDILHDFPYSPTLSKQIAQQDNFIAVCRVGNEQSALEPIAPPPGIDPPNMGFSNLPIDRDLVIRRHIVGMAVEGRCQNSLALATNMAFRYLDYVAPQELNQDFYPSQMVDDRWQVGDFTFPRLNSRSGAYRLPDSENRAYQILINYRDRAPQTVSLREILEETDTSQLEQWLASKMIFIGVKDNNKDNKFIPHHNGQKKAVAPGVLVHAQATSQIVSAVLDGRRLIRCVPDQLESFWVFSWAAIGSLVVRFCLGIKQKSKPIISAVTAMAVAIAFGLLYLTHYSLLAIGYWLPVVAPIWGLFLASIISVAIITNRSTRLTTNTRKS